MATNISGPVTILKTIELVPQPVASDPIVRGCGSLESTRNSSTVPPSAMTTQRAILPTISCSAGTRSPRKRSYLSIPQPLPQPSGTMLRPIIVGGITYLPAYAHHTNSNATSWQDPPGTSQTDSETIDWDEYYAKSVSESDGVGHGTPGSRQEQQTLPPVVVGGLTYRPIGKGYQPGLQTPAPVNVTGSATEAANTLTGSFSGSMAAGLRTFANDGTPSAVSTRVESSSDAMLNGNKRLPSAPATTFNSTTNTLYPSTTPTMDNSTFKFTSANTSTSEPSQNTTAANTSLATSQTIFPLITGHAILPASPPTFILASQTFTAYPLGLAINGSEAFQGSAAITVSGTAISLGSSDVVIGTSTIPIASVTGLGAALSSGLLTAASASGGGVGATPTSSEGTGAHRSAAGRVAGRGGVVMVGVVIVGVAIAVL